ncbi:MAG: response regulator [Deltaproteobacteria bacterium]|nr:MAG: response regulator [Deltaproteobacteria bacterium]RLC14072.1 MAG: response regulator [Deltaproteobacteria bacterium]
MEKKDLLDGKKILIVDDESDILEVLEDLLTMCNVVTATTFDEGKILLESEYFDLAILDIMGVNGYELLNIANKEKVTSVMLTAAALSPDNIVKSHKNGAAFFVPKPEMIDIVSYLNDILEAEEKGKSTWWRWYDRLGAFYEKRFGPDWQKDDKAFWTKFTYI